tara:strand:- start:364 stop:582 length:219 start_codon:yes stop_codon:yes gene_type:complete
MTEFTMRMNMDNDSFKQKDDPKIERNPFLNEYQITNIFDRITKEILDYNLKSGVIRDLNGNTVGSWEINEDD